MEVSGEPAERARARQPSRLAADQPQEQARASSGSWVRGELRGSPGRGLEHRSTGGFEHAKESRAKHHQTSGYLRPPFLGTPLVPSRTGGAKRGSRRAPKTGCRLYYTIYDIRYTIYDILYPARLGGGSAGSLGDGGRGSCRSSSARNKAIPLQIGTPQKGRIKKQGTKGERAKHADPHGKCGQIRCDTKA